MREVLSCNTYITVKERITLDMAFILLDHFAEKSRNVKLVDASIKAREALREVCCNVLNEEG